MFLTFLRGVVIALFVLDVRLFTSEFIFTERLAGAERLFSINTALSLRVVVFADFCAKSESFTTLLRFDVLTDLLIVSSLR